MYRAMTLRSRIAELTNQHNTKLIVVGVASAAIAPVVVPLIKPVVKASFKTGVVLFEKTKIAIAETGEVLADLAAEARAEVMATQTAPAASATSATAPAAIAPSPTDPNASTPGSNPDEGGANPTA